MFFHLEDLLRKYNVDVELSLAARKIVSIAFVFRERLESAFEALSIDVFPDLQLILDKLEDNYLVD
ncbi:hypothetical protein HZS_2758 [Henneguya salminicola]|nr:hypothetical protein HZS_2758 [Henneguya salminicola]